MALVLKDRVKETSTTAGTGTITLAGAVAGFQSFSAVGNGNTTYYAIVDPTTGDWEVGIGTYTSSGTTLSRDTVLSSSNSGSLVNFVANQKDVFVTYPSEKSVYEDASNVVNATSFGAITATSAALTTGTVSTAPASGTDIANKTYVDTLVSSGITYHTPVKYEVPDSTGNLNATYNQPGGPGVGVGATLTNAGTLVAFTPDGTIATAGDRIIVYNQTNQFENGIYTVTTVGSGSVAWVLTRATDADTYALKSPNGLGNGDAFFITSGATGAGETYVCNTAGTITFGTTAITFAQISDSTLYTAGTGLTLTGTEFSITPTGTAGTYGSASSVPVLTTNASGQVTSVTNTTIAINGSQVSGNISGSAGSVANALTLGTYLTGTSFNGSAAVTATVDATSANTASKVVARDSSGNFSAGTITATLNGTATSTASATNLSGGAANQIAYQSAANTTAFATAPSASNQVLNWNGSAFTWSAGTISGVPLGSNLNSLTAGTYLTGTAYNGSAAQTWSVNAASANTASTVVARDASGNFSASTITASLSGNATTATTATSATSASTSTTQAKSDASTNIATTAFSKQLFYSPSTAGTLDWNDVSNTRPGAGATLLLGSATNGPGGGNYYIPFNYEYSSYDGTGNVTQTAIAYGSPGNELWMRGRYSGSWSSWVRYLNSSNYNSYAPTLTGTGASGTWGISISGNAATATSATTATTSTYTTYINNISLGTGSVNVNYGSSAVLRIDGGSGAALQYAPVLHVAAGDTMWQAQGSYGSSGDGTLYFRQGYNGSWGNWLTMLSSYNYNSYAPTLTGTGASGTWNISITGSAGSAPGYLPLSGGTMTGTITGGSGVSDLVTGNYAGALRGYLYNDTSGFGLLTYAGSWAVRVNYGTNTVYIPGIGYSDASLRAPIFYDTNDTGYYVDPNSTSRQYQINFNYLYYAGDTSYGFLGASVYADTINSGYAGDQLELNYVRGTFVSISHDSMRAPLFYDYDNTSYYVDPASTSRLGTVNADVLRSNTNVYTDQNYGYGLVGVYSSYRYQGVFAMGDAYKLPADGTTTGSLYGMAWSHPNAGGAAGNLNSHGLLLLQNGAFMAALSTNGTFSADVRGTIFYDYNNTGYYVDPASTTYLYSLQLSGATYFRPNNWIELDGDYGLFSAVYNSAHFLANISSSYGAWRMIGSRGGYGGIYDTYSGVNGIMYDSSGNGGVYREANGRWYFYHNVSNNCTGFGTSTTNSAYNIYCPTGVYSGGRVDGTIFYDAANTGYYLDLNGSSNASTALYGNWYFTSNRNTSSSDAPLQAYSSGGSGAIMSFHRGGYYAVNMGLDSDNVFRIGGWSASANLFQMDMSGNLTMAANVTAYSDETLKKDWADMPSDFVPRLARVKSGTYTRIDNKMRQIGVGAQSLRPLMEEAVFENADGTLSVAYGNAAMASSVELAKYVTALEQRISQLEARA